MSAPTIRQRLTLGMIGNRLDAASSWPWKVEEYAYSSDDQLVYGGTGEAPPVRVDYRIVSADDVRLAELSLNIAPSDTETPEEDRAATRADLELIIHAPQDIAELLSLVSTQHHDGHALTVAPEQAANIRRAHRGGMLVAEYLVHPYTDHSSTSRVRRGQDAVNLHHSQCSGGDRVESLARDAARPIYIGAVSALLHHVDGKYTAQQVLTQAFACFSAPRPLVRLTTMTDPRDLHTVAHLVADLYAAAGMRDVTYVDIQQSAQKRFEQEIESARLATLEAARERTA